METAPLTLKQLNEWALEQIKDFIPNHNEALERTFIGSARNAFLNNWLATAKRYLQGSELQNKTIVYFAIRELVGFENEQAWLTLIKEFVESQTNTI